MPVGIKQNFLPISIIVVVCSASLGIQSNAAVTNGADIYCFMRNGGNKHEPSWQAAYQFIKSKQQGLFKTSPKQAASMIVEEVVQDPIKYEDCTNYLGDLFTGESTTIEMVNDNELEMVNDNELEMVNDNELEDDITPSIDSRKKSPKGKYIDPYNY